MVYSSILNYFLFAVAVDVEIELFPPEVSADVEFTIKMGDKHESTFADTSRSQKIYRKWIDVNRIIKPGSIDFRWNPPSPNYQVVYIRLNMHDKVRDTLTYCRDANKLWKMFYWNTYSLCKHDRASCANTKECPSGHYCYLANVVKIWVTSCERGRDYCICRPYKS